MKIKFSKRFMKKKEYNEHRGSTREKKCCQRDTCANSNIAK